MMRLTTIRQRRRSLRIGSHLIPLALILPLMVAGCVRSSAPPTSAPPPSTGQSPSPIAQKSAGLSKDPTPAKGGPLSAIRPLVRTPDSIWEVLAILAVAGGGYALWTLFQSRARQREDLLDLRRKSAAIQRNLEELKRQLRTLETEVSGWKDDQTKRHSRLEVDNQDGSVRLQALGSRFNDLERLVHQAAHSNEHLGARLQVLEARVHAQQPLAPAAEGLEPSSPSLAFPEAAAGEEAQPAVDLSDCLQALNGEDRNQLRYRVAAELNITETSEEMLQRGTTSQATRLQEVSGGGSYLLVRRGGRAWMLPTIQTLSNFSLSQPQKGLFVFERDSSAARPQMMAATEIREDGGEWEVLRMGRIIVPG